jgi:preprotein translocase subunit YajC
MLISNAYAQTAGADASGMMNILMLALMFVVLYFVMIRPQMKRQKELRNMHEALAVGDEVVTVGGLMGKVTTLKDPYVTVELLPGTEVKMQKNAITAVLPKGTIKEI